MSVTISEAVKYIGVDDKTIDLFESQYVVPHGVSYNSYLILDEKVALMDTVDTRGVEQWEKNLLLAGYGILDIVSIVILLILLNTGNTTTALSLSLVLGMAAGGIVLGILACLRMKTWPDLLRTLAIPAGSCCACGLLAFGLEKICLPHLGAMVTVLLELVITGAVYWFLLLMLRSFRGQDLNYVPGGKVLRAFGKTLRLL